MKKLLTLTLLMLSLATIAAARNMDSSERKLYSAKKSYHVFFEINKSAVDKAYMSNARTLDILHQDIQTTLKLDGAVPDSLVIIASASPDGGYEFNKHLAQKRAINTRQFILEMFPELKEATIVVKFVDEDWDGLFQVLKAHPDFPQREEMMAIILNESDLETKERSLKSLTQGWEYLTDNHLHALRNSSITLTVAITATNADDEFVRERPNLKQISPVSFSYIPTFEQEDDFLVLPERRRIVETPGWQRHLYLKTNTLGLGLAISNLGCEIDITKHLSISIPVYYSALNYFTETIKFRTLATQPELRYWTNKNNDGLFFGIHGGVAQYNVAVDGALRYQDHNGTSPAIGGGIGLGYRMPISDDNRWHIEFAIGAGVYRLHYDTFHNVHNGKLIDTYRDVYFGPDNAAINISYRFDLKKRKK